jgi:cytochrome P450
MSTRGYSADKARKATKTDRKVIYTAHRAGYWLLYGLSRLAPVIKVPKIGVIVSEAALLRATLLDSAHFSKVGPGASSALWTPIVGPNALLNMDGPTHMELRRKLNPMFTPKYLSTLVGDIINPQLDGLRARLLAGESVDIAHEIEKTAATLVCRLAGWNITDTTEDVVLTQLARAREALGLVTLTTSAFTSEQVAYAHDRLSDVTNSIRAAYQANTPGSVAALLRGEGLTEDDTTSVITALIIAGTETTISHVPRLTQLMITSGYLDEIADASPEDRDSKLDAAMQEAFRVTVPSPVMVRAVTASTKIGKVTVRPGDRIILATHLACQRAGDFNPDRGVPKDMRQLWFGAGAHFCIGMPLAMQQSTAYLKLLADIHAIKPLTITRAVQRAKTLAAGYETLTITTEQSSQKLEAHSHAK